MEILHFLALGIQLFRRVEGIVGLAAVQQLLHIFLINIAPFGLTVRAMVAPETHPFVEGNAQPTEGFQDIFLRSGNETAGVSVFNTENELTAMLAGKKIIV